MPYRRLAGSDHAIRQAAAPGSAGVFALRREAHANMTNSMQACLARERNLPTGHDRDPEVAAGSVLENDFGNRGARIRRPRFARLHASIAERRLDWAWQPPPAAANAAGESGPSEGRGAGSSTRALWLGGTVFALLAAGIISAVAALQSSRPLPFETWARLDLLQRWDDTMAAMTTTALGPEESAAAEAELGSRFAAGTARQEAIAALSEVAAARGHGELDAALAWDTALGPSQVELAGLGPVLTSAAVAEQVAVNLALRSLTAGGGRTGTERTIAEPPRPVFKPALLPAFRAEEARSPARP